MTLKKATPLSTLIKYLAIPLMLTLGLWLTLTGPALAAGPIRVTPGGNPAADGSNWTNATSLQHALTLAAGGDEIWVATGVYTPGLNASDSFNLVPGVAVYGGFAATETLRIQRDWVANVTVLSGDIDGNDLADGNGVVTSTANIVGSNSDHVAYIDGTGSPVVTETTVLDGFTLTAGQAKGSVPDNNGSGSGHDCSPSLSKVTFSGNSAGFGGAMSNDGSDGDSSPSLNNVILWGNTASSGGAQIYNNFATPAIRTCFLNVILRRSLPKNL